MLLQVSYIINIIVFIGVSLIILDAAYLRPISRLQHHLKAQINQ